MLGVPPLCLGLVVEVVPDGVAYSAVAEEENDEREEEVGDTVPRDVSFLAPPLHKVGHAVVVGRVQLEDDCLGHAQQQRYQPRRADHHLGPLGSPGAVGKRVADGLIPEKHINSAHILACLHFFFV